MVVLDGMQRVVHVNEAAVGLFGGLVETGQAFLESIKAISSPDQAAENQKSWLTRCWARRESFEMEFASSHGQVEFIEVSCRQTDEGYGLVTLSDVRGRRELQQRIQLGSQKFQSLFHGNDDAALLVNQEGKILMVNDALAELIGVPASQPELMELSRWLKPVDSADDYRLRIRVGDKWKSLPVFIRKTEVKAFAAADGPLTVYWITRVRDLADQEVARELAQKLGGILHVIPDLVLLVDEQGLIEDYAEPDHPIPGLVPSDSHLKRPLAELSGSIAEAFVSRDASRGTFSVDGWQVAYGPCGEGQSALLVRELAPASADDRACERAAEREVIGARASRHFFRNQLQHVTGLFALESLDAPSADSELADEKWQLRLRAVSALRPDAGGRVDFVASFVEFAQSLSTWFQARGQTVELADEDSQESLWLDDADRALSALLWIGEIVGAVLRNTSSDTVRLRLRKASEIGYLQLDFFTDQTLSPSFIGHDSAFSLLAESLGGQMRFAGRTALIPDGELGLTMAVRFPISDREMEQKESSV